MRFIPGYIHQDITVFDQNVVLWIRVYYKRKDREAQPYIASNQRLYLFK